MREQIEQLIAELEAEAEACDDHVVGSVPSPENFGVLTKSIVLYDVATRLCRLLADSKPVSGEIDTRGGV